MFKSIKFFFLILLSCYSCTSDKAQPSGINYDVGYQTFWETNPANEEPILFMVWYPGDHEDNSHKPVRFQDYFLFSQDSLKPELGTHFQSIMEMEVFGKERAEFTGPEDTILDSILSSNSQTFHNLKHAPGSFPVIIYRRGGGGSPEENYLLFEKLASKGFIVVSSDFQDAEEITSDSGINESLNEIDFIIHHMRHFPSADSSKIGIMGYSYGAQIAQIYAAQNPEVIDALVSLDTTLDFYTDHENAPFGGTSWERVTEALFTNKEQITFPALVISGSEALFTTWDNIQKSDRYYLALNDLEHSEFITQGIIGAELILNYNLKGLATRWGSAKDYQLYMDTQRLNNVIQNYNFMLEVVTEFFTDQLLPDDEPDRYHLSTLETTSSPGFIFYRAESGTKNARYINLFPDDDFDVNPRSFRKSIDSLGLTEALQIWEKAWIDSPHSFDVYHKTLTRLGSELHRNEKFKESVPVYQLIIKINPDDSFAYSNLAEAYFEIGDTERCIPLVEKALEIDSRNLGALQLEQRLRN